MCYECKSLCYPYIAFCSKWAILRDWTSSSSLQRPVLLLLLYLAAFIGASRPLPKRLISSLAEVAQESAPMLFDCPNILEDLASRGLFKTLNSDGVVCYSTILLTKWLLLCIVLAVYWFTSSLISGSLVIFLALLSPLWLKVFMEELHCIAG